MVSERPYRRGLGFVKINRPAMRYFFDTLRRSTDPDDRNQPLYEQPTTAQILDIFPEGEIKEGTYLRIRSFNQNRTNPTAVIFDPQIMELLPDLVEKLEE